jgi:hypothetical protein
MFYTGDIVRFTGDVQLEFHGRRDTQVKIRGFRIELGEIEGTLAGHPLVGEPVVVAYEDAVGERRLAAYLTGRGDVAPTASDLRRHVAERLPDHMVPSAFVVLDRLPLLPSGKLNRAALPVPVQDRPVAERIPATDPVQRVLAGVWAELLGLDTVGINEEFFDLGGHSLLATQAVSRIRDLFRVPLTISEFLGARTVAGLADHLGATALAAGVDLTAAAEVVLQVAAMSDDEVERMMRA